VYNNAKDNWGVTMLDFLVLGIIPGTTFQITFTHVLTAGWVVFLIFNAFEKQALALLRQAYERLKTAPDPKSISQ
jgi:hypothetical protein